jgi:DNA-binding NtrC family response regulator
VLGDHVEVVECKSSEQALAQLTAETSVVCTDFSMPKMNGLALANEISKRQPHVSCLLVTGTTEDFGGKYYVLRKPFDPQRLLGIVLQLARISDQKRTMPRLPSEKP